MYEILLIIMHSYSIHSILGTGFFRLILLLFVDKDKRESDMEEQAFPGIEKEEQSESLSNEEQEDDDEEETDWAKLEDSAPSAEDYTSQSDDDTEGNVSSNNNRLLTEQARLVSGLLYGTVSDSKMQWRSVSDRKMQLQKHFVTESEKSSC